MALYKKINRTVIILKYLLIHAFLYSIFCHVLHSKQVRSFNSNVAINFWWDHFKSLDILEEGEDVCRDQCDPSLMLDQVELTGEDSPLENLGAVK